VDRNHVARERIQLWAFVCKGAIEDCSVFHHPAMVLLTSQNGPCPLFLLNLYSINCIRKNKFALIDIKEDT
jgi:hypothetical protein